MRYPSIRVASEADEVLSDPSIDAIMIATPATTHFELASQALNNGKHCLVEKPLAADLPSAYLLCNLADERRVVLAVGHVFLYNAAILRLKRYIEDGTIGDVRYISMVRTNLGPSNIDVNVAWDLATHDVSIANFLLDTAPVAVSARGGSWINSDRADTIFATLTYPGGCLVHINASWLNPVKTRELVLVGSRKMAVMDDTSSAEPIRLYDKGIDPDSEGFIDTYGAFLAIIRDGDVTIPFVEATEPLREECAHFIRACLLGSPEIRATGRSALPVIAAVEAMNTSMQQRGTEVAIEW